MKNWDRFLSIPEGKSGDFEIKHTIHPANTPLFTATMRGVFLAGQKMKKFVVDRPTRWHSLLEAGEKDGVWMTDLPIEQAQADKLMKGLHGNILVGGLGLGYVAQRLALKKSVNSVTVVEKFQDVANLVWPHLRGRSKMMLVVDNLFNYLKKNPPIYDFAYYDIWAPDGERIFHEYVRPLRKLSVNAVEDSKSDSLHRVRCWNEDVMRGQFSMALVAGMTAALHPEFPTTLDELCTMNGNKYHDWSVPFYRWASTVNGDSNCVEEAKYYTKYFGTPDFSMRWELYTRALRK